MSPPWPLALFLLTLGAAPGAGGDQAAAGRPQREANRHKVGSLYVAGNERIPNCVIYEAIELYPGQALTPELLRKAEQQLRALGLFVEDRRLGIRPMVIPIVREDEPDAVF